MLYAELNLFEIKWKQMCAKKGSSGSFKSVISKVCLEILYLIYV